MWYSHVEIMDLVNKTKKVQKKPFRDYEKAEAEVALCFADFCKNFNVTKIEDNGVIKVAIVNDVVKASFACEPGTYH